MKHLILILSVFFSVSAMAQYTLPTISTHYHAAGIEGTRSLVRTYNDSVMIIYNQTATSINDNQFLALTNKSTSAIVMDIPADYEVAEMEIVGQWCFFGGKQYCGFSQNSLQTICHGYIGKFYIPDFLAGSGTVEFYTLTDVYEVTRLTAFKAGGEDRWGILAIAKETKTSSHRVLVELLNYVLSDGLWTCKIGTTTDPQEYFQDVSAHGSEVFVISSILPQDIDPAVNYPDTILYVRNAKNKMIFDGKNSNIYYRYRISADLPVMDTAVQEIKRLLSSHIRTSKEYVPITNQPRDSNWELYPYTTRRTLIKKDCQIEFNRGTVLSEEETE